MFVAAVPPELGPLPGTAVGVGPVVAGVRSAALLAQVRPARVVLIGTAGRYPGGPPIGSVIVGQRLGWADGGSVAGLGYVPMPPEALDGAVPEGLGHLPRASVLTLAAITTDPALVARLGAGWEVEHLETYAVAAACHLAGVPFTAVLGITNDVGPDAHRQWLAHRDEVQRAVQLAVRAIAE